MRRHQLGVFEGTAGFEIGLWVKGTRKTTFSAALTPWSWKKRFDVSVPIRLICSTDGLV
jgi:hypothetical protein